MTDLVERRPAVPPRPAPVTDPAEPVRPQPADPPSVHRGGVELGRLLARAQLTVAQAVELAAAVSAETVRRSGPPGAAGHDVSGPVVIGADGRVVPVPAALSAGNGRPAAVPSGGPPVGAVLEEIAGAVRSRARRAGPAAEQLMAELDASVAELPLVGVPAAVQRLREMASAIDRAAVRAELGALVTAIGGDAALQAGRSGGPPVGAPAGMPSRTPSTAAPTGTVKRRIGAWLLVLLVLAGVVIGEVGALRDRIAADVGALLDAGRSGSTASASPGPAPRPSTRPLPPPGPAAAGDVVGVDLRALAPCVPGTACTVRLEVRLAPGADGRVVRWSYRVVDRCTGVTIHAPGGSVAVPAGATRVEAAGVVALPPAVPAVAVFASTEAPAVAVSPPLLVGSCPPSPATR